MSYHIPPLYINYYRSTHVVIAGGAGYIGSHLAARLSSIGTKLTLIDTLQTGSIDNIARSALTSTFILSSIATPAKYHAALSGATHLFVTTPQKSAAELTTLYDTALAAGITTLIVTSSTQVSNNPDNRYGYERFISEQVGIGVARAHNITVAHLRPTNVYGNDRPVISPTNLTEVTGDFISIDHVVLAHLHAGMCQSLRGQSITVSSGTLSTQPYQPTDDTVYTTHSTDRLDRLFAYIPPRT